METEGVATEQNGEEGEEERNTANENEDSWILCDNISRRLQVILRYDIPQNHRVLTFISQKLPY